MKTTTADLFPRRYYALPLGTEFALIKGEVKTLAEMEAEMGMGIITMNCFYPDADPLRRGYKLRVREATLAEQYAAKQLHVAQTTVSDACRAAFDATDFSDWR